MHKIYQQNIPVGVVKLIKSYLTNRKFKVRIQDKTSASINFRTGVLQGGSLSSTLFLNYINDIPKHLNISVKRQLSEVTRHFHKWKFKIYFNKCELLNCNKKRIANSNDIVKINNTPQKYLDSKLTYKDQTSYGGA